MRDDWVEVELGEVLRLKNGYAFKSSRYQENGVPVIRISDINQGVVRAVDAKRICESEEYNDYQVEFGDILIAMSGATTGKFGIYRETQKAYQNQRVGKLQFHSDKYTNKHYFYYLLYALRYRIEKDAYGGAQPNISGKKIEAIKFNFSPLPEQRAIVAKIEQLFSELDNGIANLKTAKDKLEIYRQAVLKKAFEGELTKEWRENFSGESATELFQKVSDNREQEFTEKIKKWAILSKEAKANGGKNPTKPKKPVLGAPLSVKEIEELSQTPSSWKTIRFIDLIRYEDNGIKRGPFGSAIKKAFFVPSGYKVYEQKNAINDNSSLGTYYLSEKKYKELERFSVKGGDYIVSCSGTIGRIHKLDADCKEGVINQALLKIVLDENLMQSKYFLHLFRSEVFQRKVLKGTRGTGMQNLASVDEIKTVPIHLPSTDEQLQIIIEIETRLSVCDNAIKNIDQALKKSEALRQSILKKAFEGKLLSDAELQACRKEADWESAEKLLERIRKEKK